MTDDQDPIPAPNSGAPRTEAGRAMYEMILRSNIRAAEGRRAILAIEAESRAASEVPPDVLKFARWIKNHYIGSVDHACADCVPNGDMLVEGFQCAPHLAHAILAASPPEPPVLRCVEFGCDEPAGTPWSPYWCEAHDKERRDRITATLDALAEPQVSQEADR